MLITHYLRLWVGFTIFVKNPEVSVRRGTTLAKGGTLPARHRSWIELNCGGFRAMGKVGSDPLECRCVAGLAADLSA
jgi:hypothetical protein